MLIIHEQLEVLRGVLKSRRKAEQLLVNYWADKIPLIWTTTDVHKAANEIKTVLTEIDAKEILQDLHQHHNPQYGLQWRDVQEAVQQSGKGRDIKQRELHRFIVKSELIVDPLLKPKQHRKHP